MHQKFRFEFSQLMLSQALIYLYSLHRYAQHLSKVIILFWNRNTELSKGTTENETEGPNISPDVLNSFRAKIESDINTLRNLTYKALTQSGMNIYSLYIFSLFHNKVSMYTANDYIQTTDELIFKSAISTQRYLHF